MSGFLGATRLHHPRGGAGVGGGMGVDVGNEEERRALEGGRQVAQENGCVAYMHHARSDIEAAKGENQ